MDCAPNSGCDGIVVMRVCKFNEFDIGFGEGCGGVQQLFGASIMHKIFGVSFAVHWHVMLQMHSSNHYGIV